MADIERTVEVPFTLKRDGEGDGLTLEGYAAVFNRPAHVIDADGEYDEVILPGAFKRSIDARTPKLMFNHGRNPLWENFPIGSIQELREDPRGLHVRARLTDNWLIHPIRDAIRDGAVEGMSFRFTPVNDTWTGRGPSRLRTHSEVKVFELGPVTSPAYTETTVAIRSLEAVVPNLTLIMRTDDAAEEDPGTSDEPDPEVTSEEPATDDDPAPEEERHSSFAERQQMARRIQASRMGVRK